MATMIKGIPVKIYKKVQTGTDDFNRPIITTVAEIVQNVLVGQPTQEELGDSTNMTGRQADYILGIPKGDKHDWTDIDVEFFGKVFHTVGEEIQGIEAMIPLDWNKKVRVVRNNGRP